MNIYLVNSSLPMLNALALQKESEDKSICFIFPEPANYSKIEITKAREIFSNVYFLKTFGFRSILINYLFVRFKTLNIKINNLYAGEIGVNSIVILFNKLKAKNKYLLEDGFSTVTFSEQGIDYYNNEKSYLIKLLFKKYFFLKHSKYKIISALNISTNIAETVNIDFNKLKNSNIRLTNDLLIIGSNLLDSNFLSLENIELSISKLIKFHKEKYNIDRVLYRPHPREPESDSSYLIKKFNMTLFEDNKKYSIFENHLIYAKMFPKYICSNFPSSTFFTIPRLNKNIKLMLYIFDGDAFLKYNERVRTATNYLQKIEKSINFIN